MVVGCAYLCLHVLPSTGISIFGRSARSLPLLREIEWSLRYSRSDTRLRDSGEIPSEGILDRLSISAEEMERHAATQDAALGAFAAECRCNRAARPPEGLALAVAETRAAHCPGVELVNLDTREDPATQESP